MRKTRDEDEEISTLRIPLFLHRRLSSVCFWQQPSDFKKIKEDLNQAAQRLAQATNTGVLNLVIEKFHALGGTCKKCHREYRVKKKG